MRLNNQVGEQHLCGGVFCYATKDRNASMAEALRRAHTPDTAILGRSGRFRHSPGVTGISLCNNSIASCGQHS